MPNRAAKKIQKKRLDGCSIIILGIMVRIQQNNRSIISLMILLMGAQSVLVNRKELTLVHQRWEKNVSNCYLILV